MTTLPTSNAPFHDDEPGFLPAGAARRFVREPHFPAERCTPPGWRVVAAGHTPDPQGMPFWVRVRGPSCCPCGRPACDAVEEVDVTVSARSEANAHNDAVSFMAMNARIMGRS